MKFLEAESKPHGMHKCIIEEDFPNAILDDVEAGVSEAYCTNNYEDLVLSGDFSTESITQIYAKLQRCVPSPGKTCWTDGYVERFMK
jgi:hypothetical protein